MVRTTCGGNTPRYATLDPTERWMLVANQDSNWISVIRRNPETGELANESKNLSSAHPDADSICRRNWLSSRSESVSQQVAFLSGSVAARSRARFRDLYNLR